MAGQTYLQPPDLIDLVVRGQAGQKYPYPAVTFPASTTQWQRPSPAFSFPADAQTSLWDERYRSLLIRASVAHLNLIARSSFHQVATNVSPAIHGPRGAQIYKLRDHAYHYLLDRALVAFELHENKGPTLRGIREVFPNKWADGSWSVWWWAGSEEKARAKMERWRQEPFTARAWMRRWDEKISLVGKKMLKLKHSSVHSEQVDRPVSCSGV
jgi:hypothetical protein